MKYLTGVFAGFTFYMAIIFIIHFELMAKDDPLLTQTFFMGFVFAGLAGLLWRME